MAKGALNANRSQSVAGCVKESRESNNGVQFQQCKSSCRAVKIDIPTAYSLDKLVRKSIHVYLESKLKRCSRSQPSANAAEVASLDRPVELKRSAPKGLIAKCVEPKSLSSLINQFDGIQFNGVMKTLLLAGAWHGSEKQQQRDNDHYCYQKRLHRQAEWLLRHKIPPI